jgi:hypothetical protein
MSGPVTRKPLSFWNRFGLLTTSPMGGVEFSWHPERFVVQLIVM